jgi:hypothetical protein
LLVAGCGGSDNPPGPSGVSSTKTMTVTIDGAAFTPDFVTAVRANPGIEMVTVAGSTTSGTTVGFSAPAQVGVFNVNGPVTARGQGTMTIVSGSTGTGYLAFLTQGSGTVTISSINTTAVTGRVDLVMAPTAAPAANKTVSGTFNVAF